MSKRYAIIDGKFVENPTEEQLSDNTRHPDNANFHREADRDDGYKDMIQPWIGNKPNPEFIEAYPDRAKEIFSEDELKGF